MNPFAQAWLDAAQDLTIRVVHPFSFFSNAGVAASTVGVYLPDFGSRNGTLLVCRFDSEEVCDAADSAGFHRSGLNPRTYEPYGRATYIETLNDWGWFGAGPPPGWYAGK